MVKLSSFFPTIIGSANNKHHKLIEDKLVKKCLFLEQQIKKGGETWLSKDTYNTLSKYDIFKDNDFKPINDFVIQTLQEYCNKLNIDFNKINNSPEAWFNIYKKYDFQEYHIHHDHIFSAVYFLKTTKNSAKIYFKSPINPMINIPYSTIKKDTSSTAYFTPKNGDLLIFNSSLEHAVERHLLDDLRISLAFNFKKN
jgi:uncharacterized protein (TIGR02466 family)